ncbi:hypothetical protein OY671_012819, partial [Metschnikowia pulcherrima]
GCDQSRPVDRAWRRGRLRDFDGAAEIPHPHRKRAGGDLSAAGGAVGCGPVARALCSDSAAGPDLGLRRRGRGLRDVLPLFPRPGDAIRRRHRCGADGFPAGSADGGGGSADLCRTARHVHRARRRPDPDRQPAEPEARPSGSGARP